MEILAYALFILVAAIPFLVVTAIAGAFLTGLAGLAAGIVKRRWAVAALGAVLMAGSGAAARAIQHWATTKPSDASTGAHRVVYKTYQDMRIQYRARRWLHDGTMERLAAEQRARAEQRRAKGE